MQIKKFIIKVLVFGVLNLGIMAGLLYSFSGRSRDIHLNNWETESNLLVMGKNTHYGVAILGTSRARVFSRDSNHRRVEQILGKSVINLSKGGGGGLMPAELHLSHFFDQGNTADHIIYLIDPWVFFCSINNENNNFFLRDEPFEISIFWKLIARHYPLDRIVSYLQMIAKKDWKNFTRYDAPGLTENTLAAIDPEKLQEARAHYLSLYRDKNFEKYSRLVDTIDALVKKNNSTITYIMLPILIPDFPGVEKVDKKLKAAACEPHVRYYNLVERVQDKRYYYDHMHFNKTGISYFTKNYLKPILQGKPVTD
ncbi:MAG: hypothetical protein PHP23_11820 [Desulfobacterales bacterium]|nr:hypothetical protein [Desulfobacterales bacterium]MDD4072620.1 hypothetical protein [Desulfobacterales bacterium]MDD4393989.1 hypothetical protein [Desulfobacterales bacterium]